MFHERLSPFPIKTLTFVLRVIGRICSSPSNSYRMLATPARLLSSRCCVSALPADNIRCAERRLGAARFSPMAASSPEEESPVGRMVADPVSVSEWQAWGSSSTVPSLVLDVIDDLRDLERDLDAHMNFGGQGGKLRGPLKIPEDKKRRTLFQSLTDSEQKIQYFAARQIAHRLLGSRDYLCQRCWLPKEDCMCSRVVPCSLWNGIRFWLYMHPKDFLRQNNTGKLLWQLFGTQTASLCIFGIHEHEEMMWDAFRSSGKKKIWFLYPSKSAAPKSVQDVIFKSSYSSVDGQIMDSKDQPLNFVLIDGTWSNSAAMYRRLKDQWMTLWGEEEPPSISIATPNVSVMHKLRPQPSWDRTCTAAAAAGLLSELHHFHPELREHGLDKQAEAVEDTLEELLDALTKRRLRMGRSITRKDRKMASSR
ncbi:putative DTW domain-containing protein DTWD2/YfiP [Dioscorea sansibarensis]